MWYKEVYGVFVTQSCIQLSVRESNWERWNSFLVVMFMLCFCSKKSRSTTFGLNRNQYWKRRRTLLKLSREVCMRVSLLGFERYQLFAVCSSLVLARFFCLDLLYILFSVYTYITSCVYKCISTKKKQRANSFFEHIRYELRMYHIYWTSNVESHNSYIRNLKMCLMFSQFFILPSCKLRNNSLF